MQLLPRQHLVLQQIELARAESTYQCILLSTAAGPQPITASYVSTHSKLSLGLQPSIGSSFVTSQWIGLCTELLGTAKHKALIHYQLSPAPVLSCCRPHHLSKEGHILTGPAKKKRKIGGSAGSSPKTIESLGGTPSSSTRAHRGQSVAQPQPRPVSPVIVTLNLHTH